MKPHLNHQPPEKDPNKKSDLSEEHKSDRLSTRLSTKVSSFNLFGCCWKGVDAPSTVSVTKKHSGRPTTIMGANTTLTPAKFSSKHNNREGSYMGSDPSFIEQESLTRGYPMDVVFILGGKDKIVAKITFVKVSKSVSIMDPGRHDLKALNGSVKDPPHKRESCGAENEARPRSQSGVVHDKAVPKKMKKEIFSKFDKGIKAEEWMGITPEKVAIHVANRLKCDTIVDALCGFGGNTIQFAKTCNFVIGIDIQNTKTLWAKHNAKIYGIDHKIDFITGDFMKIRNLTGDIVFLGPAIERNRSGKPFSLFENLKPDPLTLLAKSLQVSYKIAIQLPGDTQLEELPQIFHQSLEKYDWYSKRFCIEIEKVMNSLNETECIIVYFGDCSSINLREEYEAIYEYIASHESPQWKREFPAPVVTAIIEKVGIRRSFKLLSEIESQLPVQRLSDSPSLFGTFLHRLTHEDILSQATLNKIIDEEFRRQEWSGFSGPNSYASASLRTNTHQDLSQSLRTESMSRNPSRLVAQAESIEKPRGLLSRLISEPRAASGHSSLTEQFLKTKSPTLRKVNDEKPYSPHSPHSILENANGTLKNSYEVSELAVSSYSVSSDYLKESSEEDNFSRHMFAAGNVDGMDESSPLSSSMTMVEKLYNRESVGTEGGRKKERAGSQLGKQFEVDGKGRKERREDMEKRKESENRSFLLQCGDDF